MYYHLHMIQQILCQHAVGLQWGNLLPKFVKILIAPPAVLEDSYMAAGMKTPENLWACKLAEVVSSLHNPRRCLLHINSAEAYTSIILVLLVLLNNSKKIL